MTMDFYKLCNNRYEKARNICDRRETKICVACKFTKNKFILSCFVMVEVCRRANPASKGFLCMEIFITS
jgi:hypothetical protein